MKIESGRVYLVDVLIEMRMSEGLGEEDAWFGSTHVVVVAWIGMEFGVERRGTCEFWNSRVLCYGAFLSQLWRFNFGVQVSSPTSV